MNYAVLTHVCRVKNWHISPLYGNNKPVVCGMNDVPLFTQKKNQKTRKRELKMYERKITKTKMKIRMTSS